MKKVITIILSLLFVLFAYFQLNDLDPIVWVPAYLIPAAVIYFYPEVKFLNGLAVGYLVAAALQWPPEFEGFLFGEMQMRSMNIELARESGGLAIVAIGLLIRSRIENLL